MKQTKITNRNTGEEKILPSNFMKTVGEDGEINCICKIVDEYTFWYIYRYQIGIGSCPTATFFENPDERNVPATQEEWNLAVMTVIDDAAKHIVTE